MRTSYEDASAVVLAASNTVLALSTYTGSVTDLAYLKQYVIDNVTQLYGVTAAELSSSTLFATTVLRDFVHRYVLETTTKPHISELLANGTVASINDVGLVFRYDVTGFCGTLVQALQDVYSAFDFACIRTDVIEGIFGSYGDTYTGSHTFLDVDIDGLGYVMQDPFFNLAIKDSSGAFASYSEVRSIKAAGGTFDYTFLPSFTEFAYNGAAQSGFPRQVWVDWLNGPVFWQVFSYEYSDGSTQTDTQLRKIFSDFTVAHSEAATTQGGSFATALAAETAVRGLAATGLSLEAVATVLREDYLVSGFRFMTATLSSAISEWVTVMLSNGEYLSIDLMSSRVLGGSLDQIMYDLWQAGTPAANAQLVSEFLMPTEFILFDGTRGADDRTYGLLVANTGPDVSVATAVGGLSRGTNVGHLFTVTDAESDNTVQYAFWDGTNGGSGFELNGTIYGANQRIVVDAYDLDELKIHGGPTPGTDQMLVQVYDGADWGAWKTFNFTSFNSASVALAPNTSAGRNDLVLASSLFSVTDVDGQTPIRYEFWDSSANGAQFVVNGVAQPVGQSILVDAADLAQTFVRAGSGVTVDQLWVRVYDGYAWSGWDSFNFQTINTAPTASAADRSGGRNSTTAVSSFLSVADADNDSIVSYQFWDSTSGGAQFVVNGVAQGSGSAITVNAAGLGQTFVKAGSGVTVDQMWVRAYDGVAWSGWDEFRFTTTNTAPTASTPDRSGGRNSTTAVSSFLNVADADNDAIVSYQFWDSTSGGAAFVLNNTVQGSGSAITVSAADLAHTVIRAASGATTDQMWVRAYDGLAWSGWDEFRFTTINTSPTVTAQNGFASLNSSTAVSNFIAWSDADGDTPVLYRFWDSTSGGANFTVSGGVQAANTTIEVSAANLGAVAIRAAAVAGSETLWVTGYDGNSWSAWESFTFTTTGLIV